MPSSPLVSVVMPTYNSALTVLDAVGSVLRQTYQNLELIVVDDCSSDNTVEILERISDPRVQVIKLPENSGSPSAPRNKALELAKGEYIAFLDSDDLWTPNKLEVQLEQMLLTGALFSCSAYQIVDPQLNALASYCPPESADYHQLLSNNSVGCLTAMVSRELLGEHRFPRCGHEDFALWLKLVKQAGTIQGVQQSLACYRKMESSVSSNKLKLIGFFWKIYRNEERLSIFSSLYYCLRYLVNVLWFKYK